MCILVNLVLLLAEISGKNQYLCTAMEANNHIDIQHPEAWELLVAIDDKRVDYILYTPTVANSLITGQMKLTDESLQALEDTVYNTPELLNDYQRVRVMVRSRHFVLFPDETSDEDCMSLVRQAFPDDDGDVAVCHMPQNGVKSAFVMPRGMQAFLGRTFNYPVVYHYLMPLCEYFKSQSTGNEISRMFLHLTDNRMDMVIYRDGALMCANSYPFTNADDMAYFALNAWTTYDMDQLTDELQLAGDGEQRAAMSPVLRKFVKFVMPAVYPAAAMRLGRNAMQAPLDLILLALCE